MGQIQSNSSLRETIEYLSSKWKFILVFSLLVATFSSVAVFVIPDKFDAAVLFMISEPKLEISSRYIEPVKIRNYSRLVTCNTVLKDTFNKISGKLKKPPVPFNRRILSEMLDVTLQRDSHLVELKVRALDPSDAALIANTVASVFVHHVTQISERSSIHIQDLIARQILETKKKLNTIDEELGNFFRINQLSDLNIERELKLKKLDKFSSERSLKSSKLEGLTANIELLQSVLKDESPKITVKSYVGKKPLLEEEVQRQSIKGKPPTSPVMLEETVINESYQKIWEKLTTNKAQKAALIKEIGTLSQEIKVLKKEVSRFPDLEIQLRKLSIQSDLYKDILKELNRKFDEARMLVASKSGDVEIVDSALPPHKKAAPRRMQLIIFSLVISFFFSCFMVLLYQLLPQKPA